MVGSREFPFSEILTTQDLEKIEAYAVAIEQRLIRLGEELDRAESFKSSSQISIEISWLYEQLLTIAVQIFKARR